MSHLAANPKPVSRRLQIAIVLMALLALALTLTAFVVPRLNSYSFNGILLQSPQPASDFTLTAHYGQDVTLSDYRGRVVLLFFGYANCPDVCPATLADLKQAMQALGDEADKVQVFMVSVDPERDSQADLAAFVPAFHPSFVGLTGSPDEVAEIATYYGVYFAKQESESALGYLVEFTFSLDEGNHFSYALQWFSFAILSALSVPIVWWRRRKKE